MSTEAIVVMVAGAALLLAVVLLGRSLLKGRGDRQILANGVPGRAIVLSVQDTQTRTNTHPVALVRLDVAPRDGAHFEVLLHVPITRRNALSLRPGQAVPVRFDPDNRARTVIVPAEG